MEQGFTINQKLCEKNERLNELNKSFCVRFPHVHLYLTAFLFLRIELRSLGKIEEGEELTVSYVDFLNLSEERRRLLKTQYFFDCTCEHCKNHIKDDVKLGGREQDGVKVCVVVHDCLRWF